MKRIFDLVFALFLLICFSPILIIVAIAIRLTSKGPAIFWSKRVGINNTFFMMPKFRTMKIDTPQLATHLLKDANSHLTPIGNFLRKSSLDELPQLLSVIKGDMSFVGPRPALYNQDHLMGLRNQAGVHTLQPGITGWAQINGRDEIPNERKVELELEYLKQQSFFFDLKIIALTGLKVILKKDVSH